MLFDIRWLMILMISGIVFGLLSSVVNARRMMFLAAAMPHSSLLAAVIGIPLSFSFGLDPGVWAIIIGTPLPLTVYLLERKRIPEEVATSVYVAGSASASVALIYFVLTRYPLKTSLWSYILGDPLLSTWNDVYMATFIGLLVAALLLPFLREQILLGVDRDFAVSSGIKASFYDISFLLLLSLSMIGFMKTVGYVLEHVLILLPSSISLLIARSGKQVVLYSLGIAVFSSILGLFLGLSVNIQVSATVGFVLLFIYIIALWFRR